MNSPFLYNRFHFLVRCVFRNIRRRSLFKLNTVFITFITRSIFDRNLGSFSDWVFKEYMWSNFGMSCNFSYARRRSLDKVVIGVLSIRRVSPTREGSLPFLAFRRRGRRTVPLRLAICLSCLRCSVKLGLSCVVAMDHRACITFLARSFLEMWTNGSSGKG